MNLIQKSVTTKTVVILLLVSLIPLIVSSVIIFQMSEQLRSDFVAGLEEQFDERVLSFDHVLNERIFETTQMSRNILFREFLSDSPNIVIQNIDDEIRSQLLDYSKNTIYPDTVADIKIFDNAGVELFSLHHTQLNSVPSKKPISEIENAQITFGFDENYGGLIFSSVPIMNDDYSQMLGVLLFVTDMKAVEPIFQDRTGLKNTGETYLVNSENTMITDSRFISDAAFNQKADTFAVRQCMENDSDVGGDVYLDYRGESIIGHSKCLMNYGVVLLVEADLYELTSSLDVFQNQFLIVLTSTGFVTLLISLFLGRKIIKPIIKLENFANELSEEKFDANLELNQNDEIGHLSDSLRNMGKKLNHKINQLKTTNIILERMSVIGQLTSRLIHDLKNPLTIMYISSEMIKKNTDDKKILGYVEDIEKAHDSMMSQVQGVLDYVRGKKTTLKKTSLSKIISDSISMTVIPDEIKLIQKLKDVEVLADDVKLQVVFSNLLQNSVESINGDGEICIGVKELPDEIQIDFEDSGPGIDSEIIDQIFEPAFTTKSKGTGLGLVSCKKIIQEHGGTISVKNEPTTFTITLPKN